MKRKCHDCEAWHSQLMEMLQFYENLQLTFIYIEYSHWELLSRCLWLGLYPIEIGDSDLLENYEENKGPNWEEEISDLEAPCHQ